VTQARHESAGEPQVSRLPLRRMMRIHQAIQSGKFPNASDFAKELEVSIKSIHRDLAFMRDDLGLPLDYDKTRFGFYYTRPVTSFPPIRVNEGELFALVMAEKALQQYRGTDFEKPLMSAIHKIQESLPDTVSLNLAEWDKIISFQTRAEPILDLAIFDQLRKAAAERRQLQVTYRKPGQRQTETRTIDPYHLSNINGEWFLFAYDHLRKDIRTFVPSRIKGLRRNGRSFPRPSGFSLEQRLRDSFGVRSGEGEFDVLIRFNERVADYIREKRWHHSQKLMELEDGGVDLQLKLSSLHEVERWVLSWAGNATIVRPKELADMVKRSAENILKNQA